MLLVVHEDAALLLQVADAFVELGERGVDKRFGGVDGVGEGNASVDERAHFEDGGDIGDGVVAVAVGVARGLGYGTDGVVVADGADGATSGAGNLGDSHVLMMNYDAASGSRGGLS